MIIYRNRSFRSCTRAVNIVMPLDVVFVSVPSIVALARGRRVCGVRQVTPLAGERSSALNVPRAVLPRRFRARLGRLFSLLRRDSAQSRVLIDPVIDAARPAFVCFVIWMPCSAYFEGLSLYILLLS